MARPREAAYRATGLKSVVTQQGRTLAWLARQCRVSPSHYSRICSGEKPATVEIARRSSDLLGVPMHLLFARDEAQ